MGKKDAVLHRYFQDDERFADLLNGYIFAGRQVIQGSDVLEKDSRISGVFGRIRRKILIQKYRDMIRRIVMNTSFVIVGLEHQDQIHYGMPVRVMVQDAVNYEEQFRRIQKRNRRRTDLRSAEWMGRFSRTDRAVSDGPAGRVPIHPVCRRQGGDEGTDGAGIRTVSCDGGRYI